MFFNAFGSVSNGEANTALRHLATKDERAENVFITAARRELEG